MLQPGPVNGGQQAPVQAAGQEQQDQGVPSDSDDLDRGREAAEAAAAPDLAPDDLAAGPSNASFGQGTKFSPSFTVMTTNCPCSTYESILQV
jgi:hypothetical protein